EASTQHADVSHADIDRRRAQIPHEAVREIRTVPPLQGDLVVVDDNRTHVRGLAAAVHRPRDVRCARRLLLSPAIPSQASRPPATTAEAAYGYRDAAAHPGVPQTSPAFRERRS